MMLRTTMAAMAAALAITGPLAAQERFEVNNIYPITQEMIQLSDRMFFTQDNQGYFEVVDGPLKDGTARCIGSGFGFKDGASTVNGICIFTEGDNTFTMAWNAGEKGAANTWTIIDGTGRFKGMTGDGIATTGVEIIYRAMPMRRSHIVGTVVILGE